MPPLAPPPDFAALIAAWLPGRTLAAVAPLAGGTSAAAWRLGLVGGGDVVVRAPRAPAGLARQHALLGRLGGLAPAPVGLDADGAIGGVPSAGYAWVPGAPAGAADAAALGAALARVHARDAAGFADLGLPAPAAPDARAPAAWRDALAAWPGPAPARATLLHGDAWPGNAVVGPGGAVTWLDWEDAAIGDPAADLATLALELAGQHGEAAAAAAVAAYRAAAPATPLTALPWWTLHAACRLAPRLPGFGLPAAEAARLRAVLDAQAEAAITALRGA